MQQRRVAKKIYAWMDPVGHSVRIHFIGCCPYPYIWWMNDETIPYASIWAILEYKCIGADIFDCECQHQSHSSYDVDRTGSCVGVAHILTAFAGLSCLCYKHTTHRYSFTMLHLSAVDVTLSTQLKCNIVWNKSVKSILVLRYQLPVTSLGNNVYECAIASSFEKCP